MTKISSSPERYTFQANGYIKRCIEEGREPSEAYLNLFRSAQQQDKENMSNPDWQKDNLEYDLRSTEWILAKARASNSYAQNIYAALCNMRWQKIDVWPVLKDEYWSCSWRHAGGIVADMLEQGDYINWYCSGIQDYSSDHADPNFYTGDYVSEGTVTDEILEDFRKLGWTPSEWPEDN